MSVHPLTRLRFAVDKATRTGARLKLFVRASNQDSAAAPHTVTQFEATVKVFGFLRVAELQTGRPRNGSQHPPTMRPTLRETPKLHRWEPVRRSHLVTSVWLSLVRAKWSAMPTKALKLVSGYACSMGLLVVLVVRKFAVMPERKKLLSMTLEGGVFVAMLLEQSFPRIFFLCHHCNLC